LALALRFAEAMAVAPSQVEARARASGQTAGARSTLQGKAPALGAAAEIAPDNRRAELVSTYLMFCYAGVSLPVIGIGLVAVEETPDIANEAFAAVITALALLAIFVDLRRARR
jgi:hypothetical protein